MRVWQRAQPASAALTRAISRVSSGSALDPYHSHFIMVDDGTESSSSAALFRYNLRMYISNHDVSGDEIETPVLSLVFNGDEQTLLMAYHALKDDGSPVIVFCDTGGAAADLYRYYSTKGEAVVIAGESRSQKYADAVNRLLPLIVEAGTDKGHNGRELLEFVNLQQLFDGDLSSAEEVLERTILTSVLNGCKDTQQEILLAVAWGHVQVLQDMLQQESDWAIPGELTMRASSDDMLGGSSSRAKARRMKAMALEAALMRKDEDVVKCLLDFGAEAAHVEFEKLFMRSPKLVTFDHGEMGITHEKRLWQNGCWPRVLALLVDGYDYHMDVREMVCAPRSLSPTWTDLTIWAVLVDDPEMAHVLWRRSRMPLRCALMASQFCRRMAVRPPPPCASVAHAWCVARTWCVAHTCHQPAAMRARWCARGSILPPSLATLSRRPLPPPSPAALSCHVSYLPMTH